MHIHADSLLVTWLLSAILSFIKIQDSFACGFHYFDILKWYRRMTHSWLYITTGGCVFETVKSVQTNQSVDFQIVCTLAVSPWYSDPAFSCGENIWISYVLSELGHVLINILISSVSWWKWNLLPQIWSPTSCSLQNLWTTILSTLVYQQGGGCVMEYELFKYTALTAFLCYE